MLKEFKSLIEMVNHFDSEEKCKEHLKQDHGKLKK